MNYLLPLLIQLSVIAVICQCKGSSKHNGHKQSYLNVHRDQRQASWGPLQQLSDFETYQDTDYNDYLKERKKVVFMEILNEMHKIKLKLRKIKQQPTYTPFVIPCPVPSDALSFDRNKKSSGKTVGKTPAQPDQTIRKIHSSTQDSTKANDPQLPITLNDRGNFQSDDEQFAQRIGSLIKEVHTSRRLHRHVRHTSTDFGVPQFTYPQDYYRIYREGKLLSEIITSLIKIRQEFTRRNEQQSLSYSTPYPMPYLVPYSTSPCVAPIVNRATEKTDPYL